MGTRPFKVEPMSTVVVPKKIVSNNKRRLKVKLRIRLVFSDLTAAAISASTASSLFATLLQSSLKMIGTPGDEIHLF
jgi:hypothetical protein